VLIAVSDDGGGIDAEAVRNRAIERGLVAAGADLTRPRSSLCSSSPAFPRPSRLPM